MSIIKSIFICILLLTLMSVSTVFAGTTGKLMGYVTDETTGEPIFGANIVLEGTYFGAASDDNGYYYINNIPPGTYKIIASAIGYTKVLVEEALSLKCKMKLW